MEIAREEGVGGTQDHLQIVKGKRTKRHQFQLSTALVRPPSILGDQDDNSNNNNNNNSNNLQSQSPTSSWTELSGSTTEEEEDMANCLILLAQGGKKDSGNHRMEEGGKERFNSRRLAEAPTTTNKAGFYVYECKTCSRCFPSFQALGGHRASHKKPKTTLAMDDETQSNCLTLQVGRPIPYNNNNNNKSRVHECSICGTEFSSGQALGGHMRRHRTAVVESTQENKRQKSSLLSLDLNLPAPQEEDRDFLTSPTSFSFAGVFSASPLVDCHY